MHLMVKILSYIKTIFFWTLFMRHHSGNGVKVAQLTNVSSIDAAQTNTCVKYCRFILYELQLDK